jgi:hypothetical protein
MTAVTPALSFVLQVFNSMDIYAKFYSSEKEVRRYLPDSQSVLGRLEIVT